MLSNLVDPRREFSIASKMRAKRMFHFAQLIAPLPRPVRVLDIGGTHHYWLISAKELISSCEITLLNLVEPSTRHNHFRYLAADGCNLVNIPDNAYDVVFSNSTIEHVATWQNQVAMASEIQRVSHHHFVQTPNYYFPIEPHFLWPCLHWLPATSRYRFLARFGSLRNGKSKGLVREAQDIRLLTPAEMRTLFPHSRIVHEHVVGVSKSIMAVSHNSA